MLLAVADALGCGERMLRNVSTFPNLPTPVHRLGTQPSTSGSLTHTPSGPQTWSVGQSLCLVQDVAVDAQVSAATTAGNPVPGSRIAAYSSSIDRLASKPKYRSATCTLVRNSSVSSSGKAAS